MPEETLRLADAVERMTQVLERLDRDIDVAAEVRSDQLSQSRQIKIGMIVLAILAFLGVLSFSVMGYRVSKNDDKVQCRSINTVNANLTGFLKTYVGNTLTKAPGLDATQSEIDRYNTAKENQARFLELLDNTLGKPVQC